MNTGPEIIETDEEFAARMIRMVKIMGADSEAVLWERQHRDYVMRDLISREDLAKQCDRVAAIALRVERLLLRVETLLEKTCHQ